MKRNHILFFCLGILLLPLSVGVAIITFVLLSRNFIHQPASVDESISISPSTTADSQSALIEAIETNTPTATPRPTFTPRSALQTSPTTTYTPSPTYTAAPDPTNTPLPSQMLAQAQGAHYQGRYEEARQLFDRLAQDESSDPDERRLGLYWRARSEQILGQSNVAQASFSAFLAQYPDDDLSQSAQFNQALSLEALGRYRETMQAYEASLRPDDPIAAYIYERMGDLALANRDHAAAAKWYLAGVDTAGTTSFIVHLREGAALALLRDGTLQAAIEQYEAILDVAQIDSYRAKILRLQGEAYEQFDDLSSAEKVYKQAIYDYPETSEAHVALVRIVEADIPIDDFQRAYVNYYGGKVYQPTVAAIDRYLATNPTDKVDEAYWIQAWATRALGQYEKAIVLFQRLIAQYPDSQHWNAAHLEIGRTHGWAGDTDQAIGTYRLFVNTHPNNPLAGEALWRAAIWETRAGQTQQAIKNFQSMAAQYPADDWADDSLRRAAFLAYFDDDLQTAVGVWSNLLSQYPTSEYAQEASYWQAKALLELGEETMAFSRLYQIAAQPFRFFALRARDLLADQRAYAPSVEISLERDVVAEQTEAEAWLASWTGLTDAVRLSDLDLNLRNDPAFIRGEALLKLGLHDEALGEFEILKNNWLDNPLALYQLALVFRDRGANRLSILTASRLVELSPEAENLVPRFIRRLIYPTYYADLVLPQTQTLQLDPALVFALIRQESLFEPNATSHANARGLMQVIPPTGEDIASRTNTTDFHPDQLWLPYLSVEFGTWYLKQMLTFFDNNQFAALAAYNAGPGRVQDWLEDSDDLDVFFVGITLSEPRTYIRRIYVNVTAYREIYGVQK